MFIPPDTFAQSAIRKWVENQNISLVQVAGRLRELLYQFELAGDKKRAERCRDLLDKAEASEFVIAFCGHFSAGKSTMINELIGHDLLPTNPIPTSANVVKVKTGPARVTVTFKEQGEVNVTYPYDMQEIQAYCTDGDRVDRVEISYPNDQLPPGVTILDTPGIDSTEDAHRVAAESQLHTADLVLYIMDYNHVQSRVNKEFIETLREQMKPTWLLVNQIDKHVAFEVRFAEFRSKVEDVFTGQETDAFPLFFTTVREPDHPHNDLPLVKHRLADAIVKKRRRIVETVLTAACLLMRDHLMWREATRRPEIDACHAKLGTYRMEDEERIARELREAKEREAALSEETERFEQEFLAQLERLLNNANLMPYHTRELARAFVESTQVSFRVGHLFSGRRTRIERERRLARFHKEVCENAATYIDIHLKKMMLEHLEVYGVEDEKLRRSIYEMKVPITKEWLTGLLNRGALFNRESVMRYTSVVADAIRRLYSEMAKEKMEAALANLKKNRQKKADALAAARRKLTEKLTAARTLRTIAEGQVRALKQMMAALDGARDEYHPIEEEVGDVSAAFLAFASRGRRERARARVHIGRKQGTNRRSRKENAGQIKARAGAAVQALEESARLLTSLPGFHETAQELAARADRMRRRQYTIALFGAFSAGKSSFANALLKDMVLPVSPHPTTATINYVLPPAEGHPHGTVVVKFKSEKQMLSDMNQALELSERHVSSFAELEALLDAHETFMRKRKEKRVKAEREPGAMGQESGQAEAEEERDPLELLRDEHLFFLKAVRNGLAWMQGRFGTEQKATLEEMPAFVAVEERACFVEQVQLYYDSPLARQGVILIDTPGSGSLNARHTEVAFNHIKHADAVVFVTYYNHAFSRADREFLIQLGRVKEHFAKDKMFFIVNAADLAGSEDEIDDVLAHVERNLLACGIRGARLYPVSSQIAVLAERHARGELTEQEAALYRKLTGTGSDEVPLNGAEGRFFSGITLFEEDFYRFVMDELTEAAVDAAYEEIGRALAILDAWRMEARAGEKERQEKRVQADRARRDSLDVVNRLDTEIERGLVEQEIEELLYYVKQRVFYRYFDEFKIIFNAAAFSDEKEEMQTLLRRYTNEMLRFVAFDLAQEMRATSLRIENFLARILGGIRLRVERELKEVDGGFALPVYEAPEFAALSFPAGLHELNASAFADLLAPYKSRNAFFVEEGNLRLRDALEVRLREPVSEYVTDCEVRMKRAYLPAFDEEVARICQEIRRKVEEYYTGKLTALGMTTNIQALDDAYELLQRLYHSRPRRTAST
ncbi:dynamin family protein [Aneurinibacillus thermoaerophilus]|uniref:dynamin family protein n=1 Tax=Aneurinibacillus thermoaerophilus TaxID=143495 RepID=UPI002E20DB75|nr:dynamin family protein [Aneurinibacillus thermoaerophilus]MED0761718.1 dynamin family protein [Aneurinibacillus thermoaerophilus]